MGKKNIDIENFDINSLIERNWKATNDLALNTIFQTWTTPKYVAKEPEYCTRKVIIEKYNKNSLQWNIDNIIFSFDPAEELLTSNDFMMSIMASMPFLTGIPKEYIGDVE